MTADRAAGPLRFCFVLHIHQPVGNFDHVFREHADDVYTPFLDYLEERDLWPIGMHVSGPLLEWLGDNDPGLHDRIGRLVSDGRVELLSGGWYEPILPALPREDRATQLGWTREEIERRFGVTPAGLWLTERVWEPDLPRDLAEAGIEYVLVDDHMARSAGVPESLVRRPLRTEAQGRTVDLLTIDERLRYLIPFRPADEIADELRARHRNGDPLALIGDDGEKFGGWPHTREWLYEGGWLAAFGDRMDELRADDIVRLATPAQALHDIESAGPVYLPSGSYPELEEWALGGHWKGFLARYDEANRMHKRMTALSHLTRERGDPPRVRRAIGRAQCNDAYWHGVFGGLYMKHLREGVRRQMIAAERELRAGEPLRWTRADPAASGRLGWWAHGARVSAWIDTLHGGTITDLLWLDRGVDVVDVLTRRREAYHAEAVARSDGHHHDRQHHGDADRPEQAHEDGGGTEADESGGDGDSERGAEPAGSQSIHEIEASATLDRLPPVDPDVRTLVRDRVLDRSTSFEAYREGEFAPVWVAERGQGGLVADHGENGGGLDGTLTWRFRPQGSLRVEKHITVRDDGTVEIAWAWDPADYPDEAWWAPEISVGAHPSVLGAIDDGTPGGPAREAGDGGSPIVIELEPEAAVWRYPIVTVSKCPDGFERIEQGESVTPRWPVSAGEASVTIRGR